MAVKCVNCTNSAVYHVADPGVNPLDYCRPCLPPHMQRRADAGEFSAPVEEPEAPVEESATKKTAKATKAAE